MTSVVIPVHNSARYLPTLLESLRQQTADDWEVVAIDNRSVDDSRRILTDTTLSAPLRLERADERANPSYARNVGAAIATGDKLLFVDADDAVSSSYVRLMAEALDEHPMVTSRVDSAALNPDAVREVFGASWQSDGIDTYFDFLPACGVNIGIRRDLFETLGGFPEEFSGSEDIAFAWKAHLAGVRLHFVEDAVYSYRHRESLADLFRQAANWGRDNALLYAKFRQHGMPGRSWRLTAREWSETIRDVLVARNDLERGRAAVRFGFCVGRLKGSTKYRVRYL
ncbi:MAG TPA: glycosyltransferase family A protein [Vicinamibacterales bacterium]|nr:glycosyltransferase family A protein [Vicinamibacterales bacterium]